MLEKEIERRFIKAVKAAGGKAYKFTSPGNSGVPDRIVLMPEGRTWFVELKTETGRLSARQRYEKTEIEKLGHNYFLLRGEEGVNEFMEMVKK